MDRLESLLTNTVSNLMTDLQDSGHSYARSYAASVLSPSLARAERYSGLHQAKLLNQLASDLPTNLPVLSERLSAISQALRGVVGSQRCSVVGDAASLDQLRPLLPSFLDAARTPVSSTPTTESGFASSGPVKTYFALPLPIHHTAMVLPSVPYTHPHAPALAVLGKLLTDRYLHREIREKGGAYGGGAYHSTEGFFGFYSFRDPNCDATLAAFRASLDWLSRPHSYTPRELEEAILSVFADIDRPVAPAAAAHLLFLKGITDDMRQEFRQRLFQIDHRTISEVAEKYLFNQIDRASVAVVGPDTPSVSADQGWDIKQF
eukprot:TRINITY_DN15088_c0_g2_i1.p1 TRINITY_DN15088_c0_g2~~TRINITY_DN15088_c0_g2_i1.p1  ORF type:complete len:355 (+),score=107.21 TRINITY_DN15088_c0_g2_i1:109-1065(+)